MRDKRIDILTREAAATGKYGVDSAGVRWRRTATVWAAVDWTRGLRAMNAGTLDAYGVVMVRMLWRPDVNMRCRVVHDGTTYQILPETFHADRRRNQIQFQAQAVVDE